MSRIHEALKKLEQERLGQSETDSYHDIAGAADFAVEADIAPLIQQPARDAQIPLSEPTSTNSAELISANLEQQDRVTTETVPGTLGETATSQAEESPNGHLTAELLAARCWRPSWQPNTRKMLFFGHEERLGTEQFRTLRSRLYQIRRQQPLKTILVTSALPAEGKTFVAANLAQAIARQIGVRVLLIDCDLRWSKLDLAFGAPPIPGLTEYLSGETDEISIVQRSPLGNLFFIPGGGVSSNPLELINNGRLKTLLTRLAAAFDWILIDSPPAIPVSDASVLANFCDGVLMVIRAAVTPVDMLNRCVQEFHQRRLLGVVLNQVKQELVYESKYYARYYKSGKPTEGQ
jgi:protein-tyrosine kinase